MRHGIILEQTPDFGPCPFHGKRRSYYRRTGSRCEGGTFRVARQSFGWVECKDGEMGRYPVEQTEHGAGGVGIRQSDVIHIRKEYQKGPLSLPTSETRGGRVA